MRTFTAAALAATLVLGVTAANATTHKKHHKQSAQTAQTAQKSPGHTVKSMPKEKVPATK